MTTIGSLLFHSLWVLGIELGPPCLYAKYLVIFLAPNLPFLENTYNSNTFCTMDINMIVFRKSRFHIETVNKIEFEEKYGTSEGEGSVGI